MRRWFLTAMLLAAFATTPSAARSQPVDLALVLAVDCSGSVDAREFDLQLGGIAKAFRDPSVIAATGGGPHGRIAVILMLWADPDEQKLTSGWFEISNKSEAEAFAKEVEKSNIRIGGGTGIGVAIGYGISLLRNSPFHATRQTIDVSGDGRESWELREPRFRVAQAKALRGQTNVIVNGLAILQDVPDLADYYARNVIGGPGSFVMEAARYEDFADAMRRKLLREILPGMARAD